MSASEIRAGDIIEYGDDKVLWRVMTAQFVRQGQGLCIVAIVAAQSTSRIDGCARETCRNSVHVATLGSAFAKLRLHRPGIHASGNEERQVGSQEGR